MAVVMRSYEIGSDKVIARFRDQGVRVSNLMPALAEGERVLEKSTLDHFLRGITPGNAPRTLERKGDLPVGVEFGALESSLTEQNDPNAIRNVGPDFMEYGSALWYAHFFQGTSHQPPREMTDITPGNIEEIEELIINYVMHGVLH